MKLKYPIALCFPNATYSDQVNSLITVMGAVRTNEDGFVVLELPDTDYVTYCSYISVGIFENLKNILNDGGAVEDLEVWIYAPAVILETPIYTGLRMADGVTTFANWNDGGTQPSAVSVDGQHVLLRCNIGGTTLTAEEIQLLVTRPGLQLLTAGQFVEKRDSAEFTA